MNEALKTAIFEIAKNQSNIDEWQISMRHMELSMQLIHAIKQVEILANSWLGFTDLPANNANEFAASGHWAEINKAFGSLPGFRAKLENFVPYPQANAKDTESWSITISSDSGITISSDSLTVGCIVKPHVSEAGNSQRNESPSV